MGKQIKLLAGLLLFVFVLGGAYLLYDKLQDQYDAGGLIQDTPGDKSDDSCEVSDRPAESDETAPEEMYAAPDFAVYDAEGNMVHLREQIGKPIVLNFWASWCPPCKAEMPDFDDAYKKYGDDVLFMMVNMTDGQRETVETAKQFIAQSGFAFPVYFDSDYSAAIAYQVYSLPSTYFIDANGNLIAHALGRIDAEMLEEGIGMIFPQ